MGDGGLDLPCTMWTWRGSVKARMAEWELADWSGALLSSEAGIGVVTRRCWQSDPHSLVFLTSKGRTQIRLRPAEQWLVSTMNDNTPYHQGNKLAGRESFTNWSNTFSKLRA
jgi:hypothetical protein